MSNTPTVQPGQEWVEGYYDLLIGVWRVQYYYRTLDGELFSSIANSLDQARAKRDIWLQKKGQKGFTIA